MWKLLREYDSDLDSGFTRVYSPNLISGFDRYHRHSDPDALYSHNENILEFEAMLVGLSERLAWQCKNWMMALSGKLTQ